jgi:hypothetical protein
MMEYLCPLYESSAFTCDRKARYLVAGTVICDYHALRAGLTIKTGEQDQVVITKIAAKLPIHDTPDDPEFYYNLRAEERWGDNEL